MNKFHYIIKRPKTRGIIIGLVSLTLLEVFTVLTIAFINIHYQTYIWFKEDFNPLYIWFIIVPLISALLGLGISLRKKTLVYTSLLSIISIVVYLSYYLIKVFRMF